MDLCIVGSWSVGTLLMMTIPWIALVGPNMILNEPKPMPTIPSVFVALLLDILVAAFMLVCFHGFLGQTIAGLEFYYKWLRKARLQGDSEDDSHDEGDGSDRSQDEQSGEESDGDIVGGATDDTRSADNTSGSREPHERSSSDDDKHR